MVAQAIPGIWELISPAEALRVRLEGAADALHGLLAGLESDALVAGDRLWRVTGELDCAGRVLAAANTALPAPDDGMARLWQAATDRLPPPPGR
jgi:hypothetical protein